VVEDVSAWERGDTRRNSRFKNVITNVECRIQNESCGHGHTYPSHLCNNFLTSSTPYQPRQGQLVHVVCPNLATNGGMPKSCHEWGHSGPRMCGAPRPIVACGAGGHRRPPGGPLVLVEAFRHVILSYTVMYSCHQGHMMQLEPANAWSEASVGWLQ
jgi:hypothetical protein